MRIFLLEITGRVVIPVPAENYPEDATINDVVEIESSHNNPRETLCAADHAEFSIHVSEKITDYRILKRPGDQTQNLAGYAQTDYIVEIKDRDGIKIEVNVPASDWDEWCKEHGIVE